jgi:hypothetical protein
MILSEALSLAERIEREIPSIRIPRLPIDGSVAGFALECEDIQRGVTFIVHNRADWEDRKGYLSWQIVPSDDA